VKSYVAWWAYSDDQQVPPVGTIPAGTVPACSTTGTVIGTAKAYCPDTTGEASISGDPVDKTSTLWIAAYDAAGNVSTLANGTPAGVSVDFQVGPDANVNWSHGHAWPMDGFADQSTVTSPVPDLATTGATALTVGSGTSWTTHTISPFQSNEMITLPGYLTLGRYYGTFHSGSVEGAAPAGSHIESVIGQMVRYTAPRPANTLIVYQCSLTNGTDMTSTSANCEGLAATATPIGYIYNSPGAVPSGVPSVEIFRCHTAVDHFDTTASNCEGSAYDGVLGWFLRIAPTQATTSSGYVVDTTKSYSVGAWLTAAADNTGQGNYTALSQAGTVNSGFYLQESAGYWRFCVRSQTTTVSTVCATSPDKATFGTAQLVTGIWDAPNNQVRLLVSSSIQPVAVATYVPPAGDARAVGPLLVGTAISNYSPVNMWNGEIDDPFVFPGVVDKDSLTALSNGSFGSLNG